jgi:hypothetical protein
LKSTSIFIPLVFPKVIPFGRIRKEGRFGACCWLPGGLALNLPPNPSGGMS